MLKMAEDCWTFSNVKSKCHVIKIWLVYFGGFQSR